MKPETMAALAAHIWAISPDALADLLARFAAAEGDLWADADPAAVEAKYEARVTRAAAGAVGVVQVIGPIARRDSLWSLLFGGTSLARIGQQVKALAADESVATIMLDIDSPGGDARGVSEVAAMIRRARESKRVVALANGLMGSAAAWLGWQADEVISTPDAMVGSQGVFTVHLDTSKALEMAGIKPTYIGSSASKVAGRPGTPLDDDTRAEMQSIVDELDRLFKADTALGRGITVAQVKERYGNGAVYNAREAKARGMVDRVEAYSAALSRLSGVKAEDDTPELEAAADPIPAADPAPDAEAEAAARLARLQLDADAWRFRS
jgi:capsid assembly protease